MIMLVSVAPDDIVYIYILNITLYVFILCFKRVVRLLTHTVDNDLNTRPEDYKFQNKTLLGLMRTIYTKILNQKSLWYVTVPWHTHTHFSFKNRGWRLQCSYGMSSMQFKLHFMWICRPHNKQ